MHIPTVERLTVNRDTGRYGWRNIFLHATRGFGGRSLEDEYRATVSYFLTPGVPASAHYVVGPSEVTRMVADNDTAFHARENNPYSLSIEVAQPESQPDFTEFQYHAAAQIVRAWCDAYSIPAKRVWSQNARGLISHDDSEQGKREGKTDVGPKWNWDHFMALVHEYEGEDASLTEAQRVEVLANYDVLWGNINRVEQAYPQEAAEMRTALINSKRALGLA